MLLASMQDDHPLTLQHVLHRLRDFHGASECVTARAGGVLDATTFSAVADRVDRLAVALRELGVGRGDRVATFAWNTVEHFELYLAVPCTGAVLHTVNVRLSQDQISFVVRHADDRVAFVQGDLVQTLEPVLAALPALRHVVVIGSDAEAEAIGGISYERLLAEVSGDPLYPELDDREAAGLCYTSGTTGEPKGVCYSHRSNVLHALSLGLSDVLGLGARDRLLPVVPMFHANAWGMPYAAALLGADLVFPNRYLDPTALGHLIQATRPTVTGGVPTVWQELLRCAGAEPVDLSSLRLVVCGGSAMPRHLMEVFQDRHGVRMVQAWGMTEMSPFGAVATPPGGVSDTEDREYRARTGRLIPPLEMRIVDGEDRPLPWDDASQGELQIRGPWVTRRYFRAEADRERFDGDWLRTGDIARLSPDGYITITDRLKDVIKSGGEWIPSVEIENRLMTHPLVAEAAVVARPDEKWGERPIAFVRAAEDCTQEALLDHLREVVPSWWLPDEVVLIDVIPKTSVGKFDKKELRRRLRKPSGVAR